MKDADEFYKPEIKKNVLIDGIAAETIAKNSTGKIIQKGFITSLQKDFEILANNILQPFYPNQLNHINKALIIITKNNIAKIYSKFPLSVLTNAKEDIKDGELVIEEKIFDIIELEFRDDLYKINIENGDRIIFIFRVDWKFGLYFDFTKELNLENLKKDLAYLYKRLFYYNLYLFIENKSYFNDLVKDGWFPFIRLIGNNFNKIIQYYKEEKKHDFQIDELISQFTKDKIESFTKYWWRKQIFDDKKEIIEAGINSFLQNNNEGFITCLYTLYPQIEGIIGLDYFKINGRKPSFTELIEYIKQKAEFKFNTISSTGFSNEFYEYLKNTVFKNFNLETGQVDLSRHTISHGYADANDFNKARALQAILILDQIYFYL